MLIIGLAALALRFIGLAWGFPYDLHPDEPVILERVEQMSWGNLNPGFFFYPGFFIYQVFVISRLVFALGGEYQHLLLAARGLTAAYGVVTVWFVYLLGARLGGRRLGVIAAGLVALMGALTLQAHYAVTDTPATALATGTLWLSVRGWQRRSFLDLAAAATLSGLAVSTKYSVAPVCVAPWLGFMAVASAELASAGKRALATMSLAGIALAAFLVTSPFTLLDYQGFVRDVRAESRLQVEGRGGEHVDALENPGIADRGLLGNAQAMYDDMGGAALIMALGTLAFLLVQGIPAWRGLRASAAVGNGRDPVALDRIGGLVVVAWVLAYFAVMAPSAKFGQRYVLPIYPALMLLAAVPVMLALEPRRDDRRSPARLLAVALLIAVALPSAVDAVRWTGLLARRDTRLVARDWVVAHLEPGVRLAREFYAPPFHESDGFRLMQPFSLTDLSLETYCKNDVEYLILSSLNARRYAADEERFADELGWYARLENETRLVHRVDGAGNLARHHPTIEVRRLFCGRGS